MAVGAALMPDAHVGYGLPIGGVLALRERRHSLRRRRRHRLPHEAVGARHAGRDARPIGCEPFTRRAGEAARGSASAASTSGRRTHAVMDEDWTVTRITRENKDKAWRQLGTSRLGQPLRRVRRAHARRSATTSWASTPASTSRCLSHSGSRGAGAAVCSTYSSIAQRQLAEAATRSSAGWRGSTSTARPARNTGRR